MTALRSQYHKSAAHINYLILLEGKYWAEAGACKYHNFLTPCVKWNINDIFGILTSRAIDWYSNESILRGRMVGGHLGVLGNFGGASPGISWVTDATSNATLKNIWAILLVACRPPSPNHLSPLKAFFIYSQVGCVWLCIHWVMQDTKS